MMNEEDYKKIVDALWHKGHRPCVDVTPPDTYKRVVASLVGTPVASFLRGLCECGGIGQVPVPTKRRDVFCEWEPCPQCSALRSDKAKKSLAPAKANAGCQTCGGTGRLVSQGYTREPEFSPCPRCSNTSTHINKCRGEE